MLKEVEAVKQQPGEDFCRWFSDEYFDLYVWADPSGTITGFQLCYDKPGRERAFTWFDAQGFSHHCIDPGDRNPTKNQSPILVQDGLFQGAEIEQRFAENSKSLDANLAAFVIQKLREYQNPAKLLGPLSEPGTLPGPVQSLTPSVLEADKTRLAPTRLTEQPPNFPAQDEKTRKQKYWGLGSIAIGVALQATVMFLHSPGGVTPAILVGMVLCFLGLILFAKSKGQSGVVSILALLGGAGPILGVVSIFLIDRGIHESRRRIVASYISSVVLFIGALAAFAITNFMTFGAKARQSEARVNLGGLYTTATSYKAENKTFAITNINQLGFAPAGNPIYTLWYSVNGVPTRINVVSQDRARGCDGPPTTVRIAASATGFTAAARGNMDSDATCDEWSINDARVLMNTLNDVTH